MKKIQCEVCGSTQVKKIGDELFECQSCGVQYSQEDMKKLLVEITGEVKIDKSKETENTLKLAYDAYNGGNYQQAYSYFAIALQNDYQNADATFMKGLSSAYQSTLATINANELVQSSNAAISIYDSQNDNEIDKAAFRSKVASEIIDFTINLHNASFKHYNEFSTLKNAAFEYLDRTYIFVQLSGYADKIIDKNSFINSPKSIEVSRKIIKNGQVLCGEVKRNLQYNSGSVKMNSWWDGSTYYQDTFGNAQLGSERIKTVDAIYEQLKNTEKTIDNSLKDEQIRIENEKEAQQKKYWDEHPEEYQEYLDERQKIEAIEKEKAQKAKEEKERLELERQQEEVRKKARQNKYYKIGSIAFAVIVVLLIITQSVIVPFYYMMNAKKANSTSDNLTELVYLNKSGVFTDKDRLISLQEKFYQEAHEKYNSGDYLTAQTLFENIGKYKDAFEYSVWCAAHRYWSGDESVDFDLATIKDFALKQFAGKWDGLTVSYTISGSIIKDNGYTHRDVSSTLNVGRNTLSFDKTLVDRAFHHVLVIKNENELYDNYDGTLKRQN